VAELLSRRVNRFLPIFIVCFSGLLFMAARPTRTVKPAPGRMDTLPLTVISPKDFRLKPTVSTKAGIRLTSGLYNDVYLNDTSNRTGYLFVEVAAVADSSFRKRLPLNLSIVIDRSGSMQGIKMGQAKRAAKAMVALLDTMDLISVVIYDNTVDTLLPPVRAINKKKISDLIDGIAPRNATNLWGGTEKGYEFVARNYRSNYINRVFLISDGLANVGVTEDAIIAGKLRQLYETTGISISTFGVGLDYNEDLLTTMADYGNGSYYFIDAPQQMKPIFEKELKQLLSVAGREAELQIVLPEGIRLTGSYPVHIAQQGNRVRIKLGDLFGGDQKAAVFSFQRTKGSGASFPFSVDLGFRSEVSGTFETLDHKHLLSQAQTSAAFLSRFNRPVMEQAVLFTASEQLQFAMASVDRGDLPAAGRFLQKGQKYLQAHSFYLGQSAELQRIDSAMKQYDRELTRMKALPPDSIKHLQKQAKAGNYSIRRKKD